MEPQSDAFHPQDIEQSRPSQACTADMPDEKERNLVDWDGPNDPKNPHNWPNWKKALCTISMGTLNFCVTFSSSVMTSTVKPLSELFDVSETVATLATSLFVLGFAVGPIVWGPLSEHFGRRTPMLFGFFGFAVFQIPVAVAQNLYTIMICRFFGCLFGSATLAIGGGALADFWAPVDRGVAVCVVFAATFGGPVAGPIVGGFITQSFLGWRWTQWITLIMSAFFGILANFLIPETAAPILLQSRARKIRHSTQNWAMHSKSEEASITMSTIAYNVGIRPIIMCAQEPILLLVNIYIALVYGILYLFFEAFPVSFEEQRGWNLGVSALPFLGILIGVLLGVTFIITYTKTRFARSFKQHGKVIPEERLLPMIVGGVMLPIGLFWFAWTSSPHINWIPQVISTIPIGMGLMMIFLQGLTYIIDVYLWYANSALVSNTIMRSLIGAGFPLFATGMFHNLGVPWASSLLAFLCIALVPVPVVFFIYGARIRNLSKFSTAT
ncbi:MFS general substrate transporter [Penicillium soppii]|uniref:MFS general substrate transporter n=1 Tax=Penicillium soppii TaxID=69789 RepID=UPI002548DF16|nr:MFS general substrate transporter [Penicillium soppii]KAJ5876197.1 MFS general substrate transporter [Penicillium soppii]